MNSYKSKAVHAAVLALVLGTLSFPVSAQEQKAVYAPQDATCVAARVTYDYKPDSLYRVDTQLGYVTDIELKPGENVTYIVGGDTQRWLIDKAKVANIEHVYLKPLAKDISTNIIIDTNYHAYRLAVFSESSYSPLITFNFPDEVVAYGSGHYDNDASWLKNLKKTDWDMKLWGKKLNYKYTIKNKEKLDSAMVPADIFDDGVRTYIKMPKTNRYDLPVLYNVDDWQKKKLTLINYRVLGEYFVADRVFNHGKLYYNSKVSIDFYPKYKEVVTPHEHFNRVPVDGQKLRPDGKKSFLENLAFEYEIKNFGVNKRNLPADVSDDGVRTYIKMPKTNFDTLPALYDVGEDGKLKFIGYTIAGNYFIVDHIVRHGKLFFSPKAYVDIAFKEATK